LCGVVPNFQGYQSVFKIRASFCTEHKKLTEWGVEEQMVVEFCSTVVGFAMINLLK